MPGTFPPHRGLAIPTCITTRDARVLMHAGIAKQWLPLKSVAGKTFPAFPAQAQSAFLRIVRGPLPVHMMPYYEVDKPWLNSNQYGIIFIHGNVFEHVFCRMAAILPPPRCDNFASLNLPVFCIRIRCIHFITFQVTPSKQSNIYEDFLTRNRGKLLKVFSVSIVLLKWCLKMWSFDPWFLHAGSLKGRSGTYVTWPRGPFRHTTWMFAF